MGIREQLLNDLLGLRRPISIIRDGLSKFPWDGDPDLVTLTRTHLRSVLQRFIDGHLTVADVEAWAETLEGRDDVGIEADQAELLKTIVFELATQELGLPLTPTLAERLIDELSR